MNAGILSLALALAAAGEPSAFNQLSRALADRMTQVFAQPERRVIEVRGDGTLLVAPGGLERGATIEIVRRALPIRDPETLDELGWLTDSVASARVVDSGYASALLRLDGAGATARVEDQARLGRGAIELGVVVSAYDPELEPAVRVLLAVLPYDLERTGLFNVRLLPAGAPGMLARPDLRSLRELYASQGMDALLSLGLYLEGGELRLLSEIVSSEPRGLTEVAALSAPVDRTVERYLRPPAGPGREGSGPEPLVEAALPGAALALAAHEPGGFVALTDEGLYRLDGTGRIELLASLGELPRAAVAARAQAGSLVVDEAAVPARIAFGTNRLATGYVWGPGGLEPLDGIPVASLPGQGFLLAAYLPGEDVFDGRVRWRAGQRDLGPFLRILRVARGFVLQRPDLELVALDGELARTGGLELTSGDAWCASGERWALSARLPDGGPDVLTLVTLPGPPAAWRFARSLRAVALAGGPPGLAVALGGPAGPSSLALYRWPE